MGSLPVHILILITHRDACARNGIITIGTILILNVSNVLRDPMLNAGKVDHQQQQQFIQEQMQLQHNAVRFIQCLIN